ncbi:BRCT domain-containing protein, partial [Armillaria gallica]
VKLMTTQVPLSDDVLKHLLKLGVKLTTRASECTHLLAPHVVRTEKFLCALAVSPWILSPKWATDSTASNKLLPEEDYLLEDQTNERKYNFQLSDTVAKAKTLKGQLFAKRTFYVTPKVSVDHKLLKNVITAFGGQISTQTPTIRVLKSSSNRHVISCPEDISIWRPIAQQFPVYTQELVLTGALKQEVEWDNKDFQL